MLFPMVRMRQEISPSLENTRNFFKLGRNVSGQSETAAENRQLMFFSEGSLPDLQRSGLGVFCRQAVADSVASRLSPLLF